MGKRNIQIIHYAIVFLLCFFFRFLPPFGQVTPYGMGILGTFIGAIYGWSTLGMVWPSFMALTGIGLTVGMNGMIASGFNMTIMAMIFVFLLMAVMEETGATTWLVNSILSSRATLGRPWLTLCLLFFAGYIGGVLNSMVMAVIFVGLFTNVCQQLRIAPYTKLPTFLMIGLALSLLMGQIGIPVMGNGLMLIAAYNAMFPTAMNFGQYMLFLIPMGLLVIVLYVLIMRFIFRVDVTPLKDLDPSSFGEHHKITRDQIGALAFFLIYMIAVVMSSLPMLGPVYRFLSPFGMFGIIALVICIMMLLKREDGTPLLDFHRSAARIGWDPVLMVAFIMVISTFMNTPETGISATLMALITPFTQLPPVVFIIIALLFAAILTNVATNLIVVVLVMPVLYSFAALVGMSTTGVICLLFICSHLAICTPAAAPPTGICMTATKIIKPRDMMKYACLVMPLLFILVLLIGIPYSHLIF